MYNSQLSVRELVLDLLDLFITVCSYTARAFNDGVDGLCLDVCSPGRVVGLGGLGESLCLYK